MYVFLCRFFEINYTWTASLYGKMSLMAMNWTIGSDIAHNNEYVEGDGAIYNEIVRTSPELKGSDDF